MIFTSAYAQEAAQIAGEEPSVLGGILPLILIFAIMYLLIIRPQQRRFKAHQTMIGAVKKGDKVLTGGGIIGKVTRIDDKDDIVYVEIADAVTIQVARSTLANVYGREADVAKVASTKTPETKKQKSANDN